MRAAMAAAGMDWLAAFHPVSIHWLTGSDAKSYQEFQCLLISAKPGPVCVLTREGERNEFLDDALADQLATFGGREPEDPIAAFERLAGSLGVHETRVGIEVPAYYLHPHHYVRIKQFLGKALVAEATDLIHDLKLVKSKTELAYIRQAGMVVTVEPPVFIGDERLGARIIDNVLVTHDGCELLSRFSRELIVIE